MTLREFYNANIRIEKFSRKVKEKLDEIASEMQLPQKDVIKLALEKFVEDYERKKVA